MSFNSNFIVVLLCIINMINYMDRFTIAGVLKEIQEYFEMSSATSGLLQTAFITSYMIFAPLFGFLGDRYSRKYIIVFGVLFWSSVTLASSFVQRHHTLLFFLFRGLVGIGEASYATVAPTLIADLFSSTKRSTMLALFYFAIPVGSGLGYITGICMLKIFGHWTWALRFTPVFGVITVVGFMFTTEPTRGAVDGLAGDRAQEQVDTTSQTFSLINTLKSLKNDFTYLISVPSYLHTTFGFTCVCFSIGALSWWAPYFMQYAIEGSSQENVGLIFGVIACLGGLFGVLCGYSSSRYYRPKYPTADPYICAIGVLLSIPCVFTGIILARSNPVISWISIFLGITFLSTNWSVVVDILLYVIVPNKRATAQAIQILISHILGDAASPFIIGAMSDMFEKKNNDKYLSLSYALYLTPCVLILGGFFFFISARYILKDEYKCKRMISGSDSALSSNDDNSSNQQSTFVATESTNNLINNASLYQRAVEYNDPSITNSYS